MATDAMENVRVPAPCGFTLSIISPCKSMMRFAYSATMRPFSFSSMRFFLRSKSGAPISSSSFLNARLTAGCEV